MKLAIISDIHSNLEALKTAIEYAAKTGVNEIVCLGDIVGYGANPNECINLIKTHCKKVLLGNHDSSAIGKNSLNTLNLYGRKAMEWTINQLSDENREYLLSLPMILIENNLTFVHSSTFEPEKWNYIMSPEDAKPLFDTLTNSLCFIGHTHVPGILCEDLKTIQFNKDHRYIINAGSVGQPRDGDPRTCFCIFDTDNWTISHIRLDYDFYNTQKKIIDAKLPKFLAQRLTSGF